MVRELRRAASGEEVPSDERLQAIYWLLIDWEYADPEALLDGVPWSEPLGLLADQLEARPTLANFAVFTARVYAARLIREGRKNQALGVLEDALERHAQGYYTECLRLDLAMLLRDEHQFGRALEELRAAQKQIEDLQGRDDLSAEYAANLRMFEALLASELAATQEALGMSDAAEASFELADALAGALDEETGPAVFGGNLVYWLNFVVKRERWEDLRRLRVAFEEHRWRDLVPPETVQQIRERFAIGELRATAARPDSGTEAAEDELRALAKELTPEEALRASLFLAQSLLDRGALGEARAELDAAWARLGTLQAQDPRRLHLLGLRARLLQEQGADREELVALLAELRSGFEDTLANAQNGPLEEGGVSLLFSDWLREALGALFELELAVDEGGTGTDRAFTWLARLHAAGTFAREQGLPAPSLAEVRASLLRPGRGLLAFVPGRTESYVFALDEAGVTLLHLAPAWTLDAEARRLQEALQAVIAAPGDQTGARLAAALRSASDVFVPAPVADLLARWSSVTLTGLEDFGYVPFEALAPAGAEPTGQTHELTYQPSLPVGVWLAQRVATRAAPMGPVILYVGEGDPARGGRPELAPLHLDPARLDGTVFGRAGVPWRVARPGEEPGLKPALADARLAVFLVHGLYDPQRVRPAGLLIEPEQEAGGWFANALESLPQLPVAIVAACGINRGPLRRGDDGTGYLRASFFRNGSDCVASPTLALELDSTLDLVAEVNARLAAGDSVAVAFLAARRVVRPEVHGEHPVQSYLVHVIGAGDARLVASSSKASAQDAPARSRGVIWLVLAGAGAVGLFVLLAALRRRH